MKLIGEFGNIETVYENLEKISGKSLKEKLETGHASALLSRELATIDCHVPLPVELDAVHLGETDLYDNPELFALLEELEFNTLLNRLQKKRGTKSTDSAKDSVQKVEASALKDPEEELKYNEEDERGVLEIECEKVETTEQLRAYLRELSTGDELAIALNIKGEHQLDLKLEGLALCSQTERSIYLDLSQSAVPQNEMMRKSKKCLNLLQIQRSFMG